MTEDIATMRVRERGTLVIATIEGEIDLSNRDHLTAGLVQSVENSAGGLLLDLSKLEFLDSSGVHMLYELAERLGNRQQGFAVVLPSGSPPRRAIELSGVEPVHWLYGDSAAALSALGD